jgi:hypothetical protein
MKWVSIVNSEQEFGHIEPLDVYIQDCITKFLSHKPQDWLLIGIYSNQDAASKGIKDFRIELEKTKKEEI